MCAGKQTNLTGISNTLMELRKCCNHPYLLKGLEDSLQLPANLVKEAALSSLVEASGKLELIDRMLTKLIPMGHRMLIYSQFTTVLNILEDWLALRGWGYQRIDGSVSKPSAVYRSLAVNCPRLDKNFLLMLMIGTYIIHAQRLHGLLWL